jgi:hypothetical protein
LSPASAGPHERRRNLPPLGRATPLALGAAIGAAANLGQGNFLAAAGWAVVATLFILAVCYLWHRRFDELQVVRDKASNQPQEYTPKQDGQAYLGSTAHLPNNS